MAQFNPYTSPSIIEETSYGAFGKGVQDDMLVCRQLSLIGEVEQESAFALCQQMRYLARQDPAAPITLYIDSPGGSVTAGLAVVDVMTSVACPVRTVCLDTAASMGAVIFSAGDERLIYPHSEMLIHDPLIMQGPGGSALAVQEQSRRLMKTRKTICQFLADRSGNSLSKIQSMTKKDTYLDADEAVKLGFADSIVQPDPSRSKTVPSPTGKVPEAQAER
jgi:ATP-dependent Clp protease protease subunit